MTEHENLRASLLAELADELRKLEAIRQKYKVATYNFHMSFRENFDRAEASYGTKEEV